MTFHLLPEYQQLTADIIEDDHQHTGQQLHGIAVPAQPVHGHKDDRRFQRTGADPASDKFGQLRNDRLC